jgi:glycosyltransferase involved in cell wall biosynthesis
MRDGVKALLAPLHYETGENVGGSELQWAYEIARGVLPVISEGDVVVGRLRNGDLGERIRVHELPGFRSYNYFSNTALAAKLNFVRQYTNVANALLKSSQYDIFHHVLPWGRTTFNPVILNRKRGALSKANTQVIVGPVQDQHEISFEDDHYFNRFASGSERVVGSLTGVMRAQLFISRRLNGLAEELCRRTLRNADVVVAVSKAAKDAVQGYAGINNVEVIPCGIHSEVFPYVERQPQTALRACLATYMIPRKGLMHILEALAILKAEGVKASFQLAGDGPEKQQIVARISELGLNDVVTLVGTLSTTEVSNLYSQNDVFVTMSYAETFPAAVLEAMSSGLAVISADNLGARQIVRDRETGRLIPRGDARALAAAMREYAQNHGMLRAHQQSAHKEACERYDWSQIGKQYSALYSSLARNRLTSVR